MAPPRKVAADLRRTADRLAKVTDPIVAAVAESAIDRGLSAGGRVARRTLTVVIREQSNRRGQSSVTVAGKPAAYWSITSYGRRGGYLVVPTRRRRRRALDLRGAGTVVTAAASARPGRTVGDDRWRRQVVDPTIDDAAEIAGVIVAKAVTG